MSNIKYTCTNSDCNKGYVTEKGYRNHLLKIHHINNDQLGDEPTINLPSPIINKADEEQGWNKDQIELALEMSMKEQFKDMIPNEDEVLEMSNKNACLICSGAKADVAFVDCGHMVTCEKCAKRIKNESIYKRKCPVCRKPVKKILKIFT